MMKRPNTFEAVAFVCTNKRPDGHPKPCCADRGGLELRDKLKLLLLDRGLESKVRVFQSGCLGGCEYGPMVMTFPDNQMMVSVTEADLPGILDGLAAEAD
jgi:(2Fe-2S) ferredoxin